MCGSYTGGKTEEGEIDDSEQHQEFAEEIECNIFNVPEAQPRSRAHENAPSTQSGRSRNAATASPLNSLDQEAHQREEEKSM